jgi:two-component system, OmpR family, response regulator
MELTRPDGSALRVLVVDDEVNIAELVSLALRYEGFDVAVARTGAEAVSSAKTFSRCCDGCGPPIRTCRWSS